MTRVATDHLHHVLAELADTGQPPACTREPDLWVSDDAVDREIAVHRCSGCRVITECAAAANEVHPPFGVWAARDRTKQTRKGAV
jgi:hypothetical protein